MNDQFIDVSVLPSDVGKNDITRIFHITIRIVGPALGYAGHFEPFHGITLPSLSSSAYLKFIISRLQFDELEKIDLHTISIAEILDTDDP